MCPEDTAIELTSSIEDYLEAINILTSTNKAVRVKDIARFLNVKMPSVNAALKILKEKELVDHEAYGHIELTEMGKEKALEIYKRHRLILAFMQEVLGVPYEIADEDACRVEHVLSEETMNNLAAFMMHLREQGESCPDWLDEFRRSMREKKTVSKTDGFIEKGFLNLTKVPEGKRVLVKGVEGGANVKRKLAELGLLPDTRVIVVSNQGGQMILEVKGAKIALGFGIASKVWGRIL